MELQGARRRAVRGGVAVFTAAAGIGLAHAGTAHAATCSPAGSTGLTAAQVATAGQTISGVTVDATGCDIGIYVGPTATGVTITGVTVSGANDHGIYAQDTTGLTVQGSTVQGNGLHPTDGINENKALELDGTTNSVVQNNVVQNNIADGGIGVNDDGPTTPGAPHAGPAAPVKAVNDQVLKNTVSNNYGGCSVVVAGYNPGGGTDHITLSGNSIVGHPGQFTANGPFIGQIVLAGDAPAVTNSNTTISGNTITGSALAGIVLHANVPGDVITGTAITGNTLSLNHWLTPFGPPQTTAIAIQAEDGPPNALPTVTGTTVTGNTMTQQYYGVWSKGSTPGLTVSGNNISTTPGGVAVFHKPNAWSGYTQVTSRGGVFDFGGALYQGSLPGSKISPPSPVVGLALTRDDGGYWMASANGNVYDYGDADNFGTLASNKMTLTAPIVGMAPTFPGAGRGPGPNGKGFYLVGSDGNVYPFGDAAAHGSLKGVHLRTPIVGMAVTPDDGGYWLVASGGGVFAFGDARYFGSQGGKPLARPIVGIAGNHTGGGYYEVAADGGVFTFGDAHFYGSTGNRTVSAPVKGIVLGAPVPFTGVPGPEGPPPTPAGGYWLYGSNGAVYPFGSAPAFGSPARAPAFPVVGMATTP